MNNRNKHTGSGSGGNRRMYDCDICMRGFTNPQALGGHRNLHRKERERNLSSSSSSSSSSQSLPFSTPLPSQSLYYTNPSYSNRPYFPTVNSYHYQTFQPPTNPSYSTQRFGTSSSSPRGGNYAQGECLGLDLSLRLGSDNVGNNSHQWLQDPGVSQPEQDDDLDLDLRLGGHHHR